MPSSQRSPTLVMLTLDRLEPRDLPAAFPSLPVVPAIDTAVQDRLQAVAERGARLGNREDVFVKVGDSITVAADFLKPIGRADYNPVANGLADHPELLAVRNSYLTPIGFENSFTRESAAAVPGRTSASALPTVAQELAAIR